MRNFLGREPLEPDMFDEWSARNATQVPRGEGVAIPGLEVSTGQGSVALEEERALVARSRAGDHDAFAVLVRLHQRQVYSLAFRMLHDADEASEATQEVFLSAWQGLRNFRGDARFATWLYRIAYNHCLKLADHHRRDATAKAEFAAESARTNSPAGALSARHAQDAERHMRETVRDEIANLPPKYRAVLVLRHMQELSYEEMADVMRVPIGTVKTQLFRARALLKERIEGLDRVRQEGISRASDLRAGLGANLRGMLEHGRERTLGEKQ